MLGQKDLVGSISASAFRIAYQAPTLSETKRQIIIPYTGYGNPSLTAAMTTYEYSMDSGATWNTMTKSSGTVITGLSFVPTGTALTFTWEANIDIGSDRYNNQIIVRLQATSGSLLTTAALYTLLFERASTNQAVQADNLPFPDDYRGIPGNSLLENAPKT